MLRFEVMLERVLSSISAILTIATLARADAIGGAEYPNPLATLYFRSGSARVDPDQRRALEKSVGWLEDHPDRLLVVEGHADARGSADANMRLSQLRTDAVRDELVRLGANPFRVVRSAFGEQEATANRGASRRVIVWGTDRSFGGEVPET